MSRTIKTVYYRRGKNPRINRSMDANRAVATCVLHMQINQYEAHAAEVYDDETGELHAAIKRDIHGNIRIVYNRDPVVHETKYALAHLIGLK